MKAAELLDSAKQSLGLSSDYSLALKMRQRPQHMGAFRNGIRPLPIDAAYWLAITLGLDPAQVVAELELEREKNEGRKAFWKSYVERRAAAWVAAIALGIVGAGGTANNAAASETFNVSRPAPDASNRSDLSLDQSILCKILDTR